MPEEVIQARLRMLQFWTVACLMFIVVSTFTMTTVVMWQAIQQKHHVEELKVLATQQHDSLCAIRTAREGARDRAAVIYKTMQAAGLPISPLSASAQRERIELIAALAFVKDC